MGAVFGIIIIIATLIYIPYRLWKEATQDERDYTINKTIPGTLKFVLILSAIILIPQLIMYIISESCSYETTMIVNITLLAIFILAIIIGVFFFIWAITTNHRENPIQKQERDMEAFSERVEWFYSNINRHHPISRVVAEVLAIKYRPYASDFVIGEAHNWACDMFTWYFTVCDFEYRKKVIGLSEYDFLPSEKNINLKKHALAWVILEHIGLHLLLTATIGQPMGYSIRELIDMKEYIKENFQDQIKLNLSVIDSEKIAYKILP